LTGCGKEHQLAPAEPEKISINDFVKSLDELPVDDPDGNER
jgi:hypothetical protein